MVIQSEVHMAGERRSLKDKMRPATLIERIEVTGPEVVIFKFQPKDGPAFEFTPGQYATLGLDIGDKFVARAYSIASSPYTREYLELYINVIDQGEFTPSLFALTPGDEIYYMGPKGIFTLKKSDAQHVLFIATGTGLAPYVSMLRTMHIDQCAGKPHGRVITLVHGVRYSNDLGYRDELRELASDPSFNFVYLPLVSRPDDDPDWTPDLGRGRITELFQEDAARAAALPRGTDAELVFSRLPYDKLGVFLCGNPDMIRDSTALLKERGVENVITEEYW
ncbi:MAG: ferredoxin--NADP reductase [Dehalococcoidia bacterium]